MANIKSSAEWKLKKIYYPLSIKPDLIDNILADLIDITDDIWLDRMLLHILDINGVSH